jgi:hypothetical protein
MVYRMSAQGALTNRLKVTLVSFGYQKKKKNHLNQSWTGTTTICDHVCCNFVYTGTHEKIRNPVKLRRKSTECSSSLELVAVIASWISATGRCSPISTIHSMACQQCNGIMLSYELLGPPRLLSQPWYLHYGTTMRDAPMVPMRRDDRLFWPAALAGR